jgi:hypothetical protein
MNPELRLRLTELFDGLFERLMMNLQPMQISHQMPGRNANLFRIFKQSLKFSVFAIVFICHCGLVGCDKSFESSAHRPSDSPRNIIEVDIGISARADDLAVENTERGIANSSPFFMDISPEAESMGEKRSEHRRQKDYQYLEWKIHVAAFLIGVIAIGWRNAILPYYWLRSCIGLSIFAVEDAIMLIKRRLKPKFVLEHPPNV